MLLLESLCFDIVVKTPGNATNNTLMLICIKINMSHHKLHLQKDLITALRHIRTNIDQSLWSHIFFIIPCELLPITSHSIFWWCVRSHWHVNQTLPQDCYIMMMKMLNWLLLLWIYKSNDWAKRDIRFNFLLASHYFLLSMIFTVISHCM